MKKKLCYLLVMVMLTIITSCSSSQTASNKQSRHFEENNIQENTENNTKNTTEDRKQQDTEKFLLEVLENKRAFITKYKYEVFLNNFSISDRGGPANLIEYAFVDFDQDGSNELVIGITPGDEYISHYLLLRYHNSNVHSFLIGNRIMQDLKEDGSFISSGGAGYHTVQRLIFVDDTYMLVDICLEEEDYNYGYYELYGEECIDAVAKTYFSNHYEKEDVEWIKITNE